MRFKVNDYIFYGTDGICQVDDVCENPFEGAPAGVCYYVLHTVKEPRQTIWNPTSNDRVLMRAVMREDEIDALLSSLSSLEPFCAPSAKLLREKYLSAIKGGAPEDWGRVMKTYLYRLSICDGSVRVTEAERVFGDSARALLSAEIALVKGISKEEAEKIIDESLK